MTASPPPPRPFNPPPRLRDTRLPPPGEVPAVLTRGEPGAHTYFSEIEQLWASDRAGLATELRAYGESLDDTHWERLNNVNYPPHWHTCVMVECYGTLQGVMAVENLLRPARLTPGAWVLYVDYIEVAPWNYRVPQNRALPVARDARFKGVGVTLLGEAVRISVGATAGGRVGLHALPQANEFYSRCGLTCVGPDPDHHDLVYWEYEDGAAAACLTALGLSA
ncbi:hypothetical protein R5W23_003823 [Gemmata sp. JC673]|uniref:GNAT family N-acetyltransferase n=1 Tax=Gemmata algarum TaxID=2975278 RepID=A0ABU5F473_9BACT|nr:hypothetical protein [Gemmata algarum]MDY3562357.1 hypothetical protein [Gemmata algarum]